MYFDFLSDNIYEQLGIAVTATDDEVRNSLASWRSRLDQGFIQGKEDTEKITRLEKLINDKKYRLSSIITSGAADFDSLLIQIQRVKKLTVRSKFLAQEWIDAISSLHVILMKDDFHEFVLNQCALTDKNSEEDRQIVKEIIRHFFTSIYDAHRDSVTKCIKRSERDLAIEHFEVIVGFPGGDQYNLQESLDIMFQSFQEYITQELEKYRTVLTTIAHGQSRFQAKADLAKLERDIRDNSIPFFDLVEKHDFSNKKNFQEEIDLFLGELKEAFSQQEYTPKVEFFTETGTFVKLDAQSDEKVLQGDSDADLQRKINEIKQQAETSNIYHLRKRLIKLRSKAKTPPGIQAVTHSLEDAFFLLNKNNLVPNKSTFFKKLKPSGIENQNKDQVMILWKSFIFPIIPSKAYSFSANGDCLGEVLLPERFSKIKSLVTILIFVFICYLISLSFGAKEQQEEARVVPTQTLEEIMVNTPKESAFDVMIDYISARDNFRNPDYREALIRFQAKFINVYERYLDEEQAQNFLNLYGVKLFSLSNEDKSNLIKLIYAKTKDYLITKEKCDIKLFEWIVKMGGYLIGRNLVEDYIFHFSTKQNANEVKNAMNIARKYRIKLNKKILLKMISEGIITSREGLILCESFEQMPENEWKKAILEIWSLQTPLSIYEQNLIIEKSKNKLPALRTDLLSIFLDETKYNLCVWPDKITNFSYPVIEKRVKMAACLYHIKRGEIESCLKLAETIPLEPENDELLFLRLPILFHQDEFAHIIRYIESKDQPLKLDQRYSTYVGLSYMHQKKTDKAENYLRPVVNDKIRWYLKTWKELNNRKEKVRNYVLKMLKAKKGRFEKPARRIYLMQDDNEAAAEREKFILNEINNDFNVQKMTAELEEGKHVLLSILGLIDSALNENDPERIRAAREYLMRLRALFYSAEVDVRLGRVFSRLGKEQGVIEVFSEVEDKALTDMDFPSALLLLRAYSDLGFKDKYKKLSKTLYKKSKKTENFPLVLRTLSDLSSETDDKLDWLLKIDEPTIADSIKIDLLKIKKVKVKADLEDFISTIKSSLNRFETYSACNKPALLNALARVYFDYYHFTGDQKSLRNAVTLFKKSSILNRNTVSLNNYLNSSWSLILSDNFKSKGLHLLNEAMLDPLYLAVAEKGKGEVDTILENIGSSSEFMNMLTTINEILVMKESYLIIPPAFFTIMRSIKPLEEEMNKLLLNPILSSIDKKSFSEYYLKDRGNLRIEYLNEYFQEKEEYYKKVLKKCEDGSKEYIENLGLWLYNQLMYWIYSNEPLKIGFTKLFEKAAYYDTFKKNLYSKYLNLLIHLYHEANWYDPEKKYMRKIAPSYLIEKAFRAGESVKKSEIGRILSEADECYKAMKPFHNDDLFVFLKIADNLEKDLSDYQKKIYILETELEKNPFKEEFLKTLSKKLSGE